MDTQIDKDLILSILESWVSVNTGTDNLEGLDAFKDILIRAFLPLNAHLEIIDLPGRTVVSDHGDTLIKPVGKALVFTKRPDVRPRVLFSGHMDTVFSAQSPFQDYKMLPHGRMNGPGSCDMKGGLLILLETLKLWESSKHAHRLGWQVIINPDEEVGSPSSESLLTDAAKNADVGLIFEPSFADGTLVSSRKGSATLTFIARGVAAHAGRDFHKGKSAVVAMSRFIAEVDALNVKDININFGHLAGGKATNIIPDLAICRVGIRANTLDALKSTIESIKGMAVEREIPIEIVLHTLRPPKTI
jgi:glutamate carboxypeptidase